MDAPPEPAQVSGLGAVPVDDAGPGHRAAAVRRGRARPLDAGLRDDRARSALLLPAAHPADPPRRARRVAAAQGAGRRRYVRDRALRPDPTRSAVGVAPALS